MKKIIIGLAMAVAALAAFAEPSFDQMQTMIGQKQYSSAAAGLEMIIQNHPTSAKAFYAMAQAQAGLGDLAKAKRALDKARGLDPELKFASEDNVKALEQAITPQVAKIEVIETSHFWRNFLILLAVLGASGSAFMFFRKKKPVYDKGDYGMDTSYAPYAARPAGHTPSPAPEPKVIFPTPPDAQPATMHTADEVVSASDLAYMKDYTLIDTPAKKERAKRSTTAKRPAVVAPPAPPQTAYAPAPGYSAPQPNIVNNHYGSNSGSSDLFTGMLVGNMLSNSSNHSSHTDRIVEREVIVERPVYRETPRYEAPAKSSEWEDNTPAPSKKSSSWDDTPAKSSSWDDDTSSKSSSSWGSSSSSSSSDSWSSSSDSSSSSSSDSGSSDW